jgi:predicted metal-dependent enzyme (double-stranded beta helix superfamily)
MLVAQLDEIVERVYDPAALAEDVAACLASMLERGFGLTAEQRLPGIDSYRQHLVHVHPQGSYSIVSLVWTPGQETPIHDHRCWCVVGVVEGQERETRYHLLRDDEDMWLLESGSSLSQPGDVSLLVPPAENIHRVENASDVLAISLHVYGADIGRVGSSIDCVFDRPVVVERPPRGRRADWRKAAAGQLGYVS